MFAPVASSVVVRESGQFAVPSRTLRSQVICLLVIIHLHACTGRKEAVDIAALYKIHA